MTDDLRTARGIAVGIGISVALWVVIAVAWWVS